MSVLTEYEQRMKLEPLTGDEILHVVEDAEAFLTGGARSIDPRPIDEIRRVILLMHEILESQAERLGITRIPEGSKCAYCLVAAGRTDEAWMDLPSMTFDEAQAHAQVCEHNPLVRRMRDLQARNGSNANEASRLFERNRELEAQNEDLRGRALGIDDNLRDAIRALLNSEAPAGELRRALAELVR